MAVICHSVYANEPEITVIAHANEQVISQDNPSTGVATRKGDRRNQATDEAQQTNESLNQPAGVMPTKQVKSTSIIEKAKIADSDKSVAKVVKPKYDIEKLQANPVLFDQSLNQAINAKDWESVVQLLPYYKALASSDLTLIKFAEASIEQSQNKFKPIITLYQTKLETTPEDYSTRLNLATALQADKQFREAKTQLLLLQATDVPKSIRDRANRALASIDKIETWRFNITANLFNDANVNNAPPKYIQDRFGTVIEQEAGSDVSLSASANKRFNLPKHYYATVGSNVFLDGFWNNDDKVNYLITGSAGLGYNDAKNDWSLTPSITKRIYDDSAYSQRLAVNLRGSRWLNKKLRLNAATTFSQENFDKDIDDRRQTQTSYVGLSGSYVKDAKESFGLSIGHQDNKLPNLPSNDYEQDSLAVSWNIQWANNLSTGLSASYTLKDYADPALRYTNEAALKRYYDRVGGDYGSIRQDQTGALGLQVWKRDFTLYGVTPRLNLKYSKIASNFDYYDDRNDKSATIVLSKSF
ncbi:MAG: surface lipoprotein assembly modifier [Psychrobacter sp.]|nr:surface lipoprotein assembly modifier [Psychrobacter sp.]